MQNFINNRQFRGWMSGGYHFNYTLHISLYVAEPAAAPPGHR